jgi:hypothetical protein
VARIGLLRLAVAGAVLALPGSIITGCAKDCGDVGCDDGITITGLPAAGDLHVCIDPRDQPTEDGLDAPEPVATQCSDFDLLGSPAEFVALPGGVGEGTLVDVRIEVARPGMPVQVDEQTVPIELFSSHGGCAECLVAEVPFTP